MGRFSFLHKNDKKNLKVDLILGVIAVKFRVVMLETLPVWSI